jgi:hypothetical protein
MSNVSPPKSTPAFSIAETDAGTVRVRGELRHGCGYLFQARDVDVEGKRISLVCTRCHVEVVTING